LGVDPLAAQLANLRELVRSEQHQGLVARARDLSAQRRFSLREARNPIVIADGQHKAGYLRPALPTEVLFAGRRLLEQVVQDAGGDHVVRGSGAVEQGSDLERMQDERSAVRAALAVVHPLGVLDRRLCLGKANERWIPAPDRHAHKSTVIPQTAR